MSDAEERLVNLEKQLAKSERLADLLRENLNCIAADLRSVAAYMCEDRHEEAKEKLVRTVNQMDLRLIAMQKAVDEL